MLDGLLTIILHELLHPYLDEKLSLNKMVSYDVEEPMIRNLEKSLMDYLLAPSRAYQVDLWTRAINRKLGKR